MNNAPPEISSIHEWQMGLPANEYYAYRKREQRRREAYSESEHEMLEQLERVWRASLPILSLKELVDVYPGSEGAAKRGLKVQMKQVKDQMSAVGEFRDVWHDKVINNADFRDQSELTKWLEERCAAYIADYEKEMKKLEYQMRALDPKNEVATPNGITDDMIAAAKLVPIPSMIKVNRMHKAKCLWHNEKTASLHIFRDNHVHCFGCGKTADAIAVFMALNGCEFTEAVKKMV